MNTPRCPVIPRWPAGVLGLVFASGLLPGPVVAQESRPKPTAPETANASDLRVFELRHMAAEAMVSALQNILGNDPTKIRLVADVRTNTVLVSAPPADLARVKDIIQKLDIPAPERAPKRLSVFPLRSIEADKSLEAALQLVFTGTDGTFALDQRRKLVIVSADQPTTDAVGALLTRLENTADAGARPGQDVQVRVVWLVNSQVRDDAPALSDDLNEVLPTLAKLGIARPRVAAQALINVTPNAQFQTRGVATLDGPCQFTVTGRYSDKREPAGLEITIGAMRPRGQGPQDLCNIQTEISAPPGHLVVLGATPTEALTSAFVVQVLRPEAKPPGPRK